MRTVEINGTKIPVIIGHRAMIDYERHSGRPSTSVSNLEESTLLLYYALKQGAKRHALQFDMDFEAFIDYCDEHPEIVSQDSDMTDGEQKKT